ncbi:DUF302 domain-containing protein [Arthrobacter sp. UYEF20]|uniref:DUF302 domain-containing protein n=1 Tax=Arthrobacter sp. UYEF20 TaxID=1756363 RepID=UPI00339A83A8
MITTRTIETTNFESQRLAIGTNTDFDRFVETFEAEVPAMQQSIFIEASDWDDVTRHTAQIATHGFLLFWKMAPSDGMILAGDTLRSRLYLMGNPVIAESMYRHHPAVMLYAPLRVEIYEEADTGLAVLAIDLPSLPFGSFGIEEISKVGHELDTKVENLLAALGLPPGMLSAKTA